MADFVSRSKVEFELCGGNLPEKYKAFVRRVLNDKNLIPSADVAQVVRCRDCKFNSGAKKCLNPDSFFVVPSDDDFCSYGELMDGGDPDGR